MLESAGTRSPTKNGTLRTLLLCAVVVQAGWAMYTTITEFEVDHNRSSSPWDLVAGVVSGGEVVGVLLVLARRRAGFAVAVSAEALRVLIALFTKASPDAPIVVATIAGAIALLHVHHRDRDNPTGDVDGVRASPDHDAGQPAGRGGPAGKPDVFLSYSRKQFYFAESLMLRLEDSAVSVWFDTHRIQAGVDCRESIDRGLAACASLVLVASRDAMRSPHVDHEWRAALGSGKRVYVVLFEAVELPPELEREAVAVIDMRSRFEPEVEALVELLARPRHHRDRIPRGNPLRLPLRLPPSVVLTTATLALIVAASLFFDVLNARTLVAITTPHEENIPERSDPGFTTHLLGFTFHGLSSKVYAFLGITAVTLALTALAAFLLVAILYRRRFFFGLLPLALLGSCRLYLNTSFIDHSTSHVVVSISHGLMSTPANLNSSAWRDLDDVLLGRYVEYSSATHFDHGSPFLSVGDAGSCLTTTAARWRWPALLLFGLAVIAFRTSRRSASLYRRLATGVAPDELRLRHNAVPGARIATAPPHRADRPEESAGWRLLHHPADREVAREVEAALADRARADGGGPTPRGIVVLTNRTPLDWLEDVEREGSDLVYVVCTSIRHVETSELLSRHQWFDHRERSRDKLALLARSLRPASPTSAGYSFPALPERLTRVVVPGPVWYKSHAMRLCATWLLAVTLFGGGRAHSSFIQDEGAGRLVPVVTRLMFLVCVPCCLYLFWLAVELASCRTTYPRFRARLNTVVVVLFTTQLQFLLSFDDQLGTVLLGALVNAFLAVAWLTPDPDPVRRWLPTVPSREVDTPAVPLRHQFARSTVIYLAWFALSYWSAVTFFADSA
ncbi:toll/interleukin-1 receptor domain-containing protein [Actinosynnema sp. NPDC053489]|uniref:toll/interleukin-1 receptor domain-containing protein n=1 Tax=Actinosynnema sp. NPDC053489 TaxID=3363916 RepID=UPI0037CB7664